jgi:hypothetical protein
MKAQGILAPLLVRELEESKYEVVAVWNVRRASVKRRRPLFRPVLRFRKVCIMKLSHFRGSLQCTKNEGWRRDEFRKCFAIREEVGGRDRDRTGDPLLAKQVLSQLSYTPTDLAT